jgi:hypothetical protein
MTSRGEAGWELISATAAAFEKPPYIFIQHTLFWRRLRR